MAAGHQSTGSELRARHEPGQGHAAVVGVERVVVDEGPLTSNVHAFWACIAPEDPHLESVLHLPAGSQVTVSQGAGAWTIEVDEAQPARACELRWCTRW